MILPLRCWWQAYLLRYLVARTRAGNVLFASAISTRQMWGFMVLNYLIVVLTLGLGWPWVMHRTLRLIAARAVDLRRAARARDRPAAASRPALRRGPARHVRRDRLLTMAARARYYDGKVALAREVRVRPASHELLIFDAADSSVVARWPASELVVLGDTGHEKAPPVARRGEEARLVIEDAELRRQLAGRCRRSPPLGRPRPAAVPRIALFGATLAAALGLFWLAVDVGSGYVAPYVPYDLQRRLGESVAEDLTGRPAALPGQAPGWRRSTASPTRLAKAADYPHPVSVRIVKGGPVNAFTLPGGILVFYSDLIDLRRATATRWPACWRTRWATSCTITRSRAWRGSSASSSCSSR